MRIGGGWRLNKYHRVVLRLGHDRKDCVRILKVVRTRGGIG
jgi:hypothetical protein